MSTVRNKYCVFDRETENHEFKGRFSSPFYEENYTVLLGWKKSGDAQCSWLRNDAKVKDINPPLDDVKLLVGHNIKFDLLHGWGDPELHKFFREGGTIWCTQYAEYLLEAMQQSVQMVSLETVAVKYGGTVKLDAVKALWESGMLTSEIDPPLLLDYLVGTVEEKRDAGDVGNTEKVFLAQIRKAQELGMLPMIQQRMEGLLCTTEMEYNGLFIDIQEARKRTAELSAELTLMEEELDKHLPALPPELAFNWKSLYHKSCLLFGGTVKYKTRQPMRDERGAVKYKQVSETLPLFDGVPTPTGELNRVDDLYYKTDGTCQDVAKSGLKKGSGKFKIVKSDGEIRTKWEDTLFTFPQIAEPLPEWKLGVTDALDGPIYSTNDDTIHALAAHTDIPFLVALSKRAGLAKDLGTYYVKWDDTKQQYSGMLTCVNPSTMRINHNLNHTSTVTSRLSSSKPNLQNIPREGTSEVKKMFASRFGTLGVMMEADYSQLEVIVQGLLSKDENLCKDLRSQIDFHCKRVASKYDVDYETALYRCKDPAYEHHKVWKGYRTKCKEFSFQRAYGAGAAAIALSTGMSVEDVQTLIKLEDMMYPGVEKFNVAVLAEVQQSAVPFKDFTRDGKYYKKGYYKAFTGTRYGFRSYDAPAYAQARGQADTFMPTELKNYPVQGTAGEIVQLALGKLFRHFNMNQNYGGKALLCNTVHDSFWIDVHEDILDIVASDVHKILTSVPQYLEEIFGIDCNVPFPVEVEAGTNMYNKKLITIED